MGQQRFETAMAAANHIDGMALSGSGTPSDECRVNDQARARKNGGVCYMVSARTSAWNLKLHEDV